MLTLHQYSQIHQDGMLEMKKPANKKNKTVTTGTKMFPIIKHISKNIFFLLRGLPTVIFGARAPDNH